ncbi:PREDICTED: odorant receptor 13a-like [Papilio xuthus]|uniref:Odorant receptor n=1 Tax=Papilio xuthus TaxID=66420 RepID=A0AAJ6Z374_PAPXU|nr:PREDICTED: odorant receptor 13a-like [Papilio xuthus]WCC57654.1 odorant receptor 4 [Papilio xuthus]
MDVLKFAWIKLTPTRALESCGKLEKAFFGTTYRLLYITGLSTFESGIFYAIYSRIVKTIIGLFIFAELWNLVSEADSLDGIIANINVTIIHLIAVYRYRNMASNKVLFKRLATASQVENFDISTKQRKKLVDFWASENEKYLRLLLTLGMCTLSIWYVYPLVDDIEYNLVVTMRLPYDFRNPTLYPPTYLATVLAFNEIGLFVMVNDIILQAHLIHLICQYAVLANCFENIVTDCSYKGLGYKKLNLNNKFKTKYLKRFDNLIDQHKFILMNSMKLRNTLSLPMLCQLTSSGMLICLAGYQVALTVKISITKFLASLLYLGYNVFELFLFCRWCDEIKIQSENISNSVYCSNWECGVALLRGVRPRIMFIIARAQKPLALSAGGFFDLSLVTFTTLMKTSYSMLTVLLRFQD